MNGRATGAGSVFLGFGMAAMALGALLAVIWLGLWIVEALGGPDWRMPMSLLQSAAALVFIGCLLRLLLQARAAPTAGKDKG